jgi:cytochrome c553
MAIRAILSLFLAVASAGAHAQNVSNGQSLFQSICSACHVSPPSPFDGPALAANNPALIKSAINGLIPNMSILRGQLNDSQLADIAAYIGSVLSPPATPPPSVPTPQFDYSDIWWNPNESGMGFNAVQHASGTLFGVIYAYEAPNRPVWYVLADGKWTADNVCSGALYHVTGSPASVAGFKPGDVTQVGIATLTFTDKDHGSLVYTVNGVQVTKLIERQPY